jgi:hypothetical protein
MHSQIMSVSNRPAILLWATLSSGGRQKCGRGVREKNEECIEERGEPFLAALHP